MTLTTTIKVTGAGGTVLRIIPDQGEPVQALREGEEIEVSLWEGQAYRLEEAAEPEPSDITSTLEDE